MRASLLVLLTVLAGCGPTRQQLAWQQQARQPLTCQKGDDCEYRWGRVVQWLTANSHWKLRNVTDFIVTTEGPDDTVWLAYSVQKVPQGDGSYSIEATAGCGDPFVCVPYVWEALADFNVYVGSGAGPTASAK
jgi:hypothetical protein